MSKRISAESIVSCVVLTVALLTSGVASAQEFRATVTGRVADPNSLPVPGATVTILNTQTGEVAVGATTRDGAYTIVGRLMYNRVAIYVPPDSPIQEV